MLRVSAHECGIRATLCFPTTFIGFKGHFPDRPVLPGVCLVQALLILVERLNARKVYLREIVRAKFSAIVTPEETISILCDVKGPGRVSGTVKRCESAADDPGLETETVAKLMLDVVCADEE